MFARESLTAISISVAVIGACVACGALESMDQVEKSTTAVGLKMDETNDEIEETNSKIDETNQKMDEMKSEMGEMNDKLIETNRRMETMNRALDRMYQDLRQGDALAARLQTLETISGLSTVKSKALHAAQYFMSFEYQLWKGDGIDDVALRDILARDAVDEFAQTIRRFAKSDLPVNAMGGDNNTLSLQALALTCHILNSNAVVNARKNGQPVASMHELLSQALRYGRLLGQDRLSRAEVPLYAQYALKYPDLMKYILELRINMFPAMLASTLSRMDDDSFFSRWFARASSWLRPWDAELGELSSLEIEELLSWMEFARNDLELLNALELKPRLDPALVRVLKHLQFVDNTPPVSPDIDSKRSLAVSDLKTSLDKFITALP